MRAFEWNKLPKFNHPEDMQQIIKYLEQNGRIHVPYKELENMYYDYSESVCCSWRCVDRESLKEFADYLTKCEVHPGGYSLVKEYDDYDDEEEY